MSIDNGTADEAVFDQVFARGEVAPEAQAQPDADGPIRDEMGRFAPKSQPEPEAQPQPDVKAEAVEPPPEQQEQRDPSTGRMIPLPELMSERQKRQEAERRAAEYEGQIKAFQTMLQNQQRPQPPPQQQVQPPDPYADPEGYAQFNQRQMHLQFRDQIANMSEAIARRTFGGEIVEKAQKWALEAGVADRFYLHARDPYGELVEAFKRNEAMQRIGPDPDAYEKQLEDRIRAKVLAELKAGNNGQPKPQFPGSLATATASGKQGAMLSPQAAADSVFARPAGG